MNSSEKKAVYKIGRWGRIISATSSINKQKRRYRLKEKGRKRDVLEHQVKVIKTAQLKKKGIHLKMG